MKHLKLFEDFSENRAFQDFLRKNVIGINNVTSLDEVDEEEVEKISDLSFHREEWTFGYYVGISKHFAGSGNQLRQLQEGIKAYDPKLKHRIFRYEDANPNIDSFLVIIDLEKDTVLKFVKDNYRDSQNLGGTKLATLAKQFPEEMRSLRGTVSTKKFGI